MGMIFVIPTEIEYGTGIVHFLMYVNESAPPLYAIMNIIIPLQSILTIGMALLKPDVQKMVRDLLTSCCCYDGNNQVDGSDSTHNNTTPRTEEDIKPSLLVHRQR